MVSTLARTASSSRHRVSSIACQVEPAIWRAPASSRAGVNAGMLRTFFQLHAGLDRQRGNEPAAAALERRAEALGPAG